MNTTPDTAPDPRFDVVGKDFVWHSEEVGDVTIPLRITLGIVRRLSGRDLDAEAMFEILDSLIPGAAETLDAMDLAEFQTMFLKWQAAYSEKSGASLGE